MNNFSVLIGGKAGDGINQAGLLLARLFSQLGYRIYTYFDYPSLIRGGHNFSIIRASQNKVATHEEKIDFLLALNKETVNLHKNRLKTPSYIICDSDTAQAEGLGINLTKMIKEENAASVMRNSPLLRAFSKSAGIRWGVLEKVLRNSISRDIDLNLKLALKGYNKAKELLKIESLEQTLLPALSGNEIIALGLIKAGLKAYIAYPMTPSSGILHFLAKIADEFDLKVIHPENEIAVILMALGFSYAGEKAAVGTSGGGFDLMNEGISLSGMAELPIVIIIAQRPGPSTGVPTYTAQADLHSVLNAGHGEFVRFVVSPGDAEEAYFCSQVALKISWKFQIPSIILADKALSEGIYSFDIDSIEELKEEPVLWNRKAPYRRYLDTETGISPLTFLSDKEAIIKVNSYAHDEFGITTEKHSKIKKLQDKYIRKEKNLAKDLEKYETVKVYGNKSASLALLCWGSNKGVCVELAESLGLKVIQPVVLSPFPVRQFCEALNGVKRIVSVENNATAQLVRLINQYGFRVDEKILKYDGRPFSLDELEAEFEKAIK